MIELVAPAPKRWKLGRYTFERHGKRWGCCYRNMYGVGNCRTPIGALIRLLWVQRCSTGKSR